MSVSMPPFNDYRDIGRMLHDTRESMGMALEEVAKQLRVRYKYLVSLEKGELGDIPGDVYARGYLKMYADFLGYNGQQIVTQVQATPATQSTQYLPPERAEHRRKTLLIIIFSLLALMAVLLMQLRKDEQAKPADLVDAMPSTQGEHASRLAFNSQEASVFPELCQTSGERLLPASLCRGDALLAPPIEEHEAALSTIMELRDEYSIWKN